MAPPPFRLFFGQTRGVILDSTLSDSIPISKSFSSFFEICHTCHYRHYYILTQASMPHLAYRVPFQVVSLLLLPLPSIPHAVAARVILVTPSGGFLCLSEQKPKPPPWPPVMVWPHPHLWPHLLPLSLTHSLTVLQPCRPPCIQACCCLECGPGSLPLFPQVSVQMSFCQGHPSLTMVNKAVYMPFAHCFSSPLCCSFIFYGTCHHLAYYICVFITWPFSWVVETLFCSLQYL